MSSITLWLKRKFGDSMSVGSTSSSPSTIGGSGNDSDVSEYMPEKKRRKRKQPQKQGNGNAPQAAETDWGIGPSRSSGRAIHKRRRSAATGPEPVPARLRKNVLLPTHIPPGSTETAGPATTIMCGSRQTRSGNTSAQLKEARAQRNCLEREVRRLTQELTTMREGHEKQENQIRQDMLLDLLLERNAHSRASQDLDMAKSRAAHAVLRLNKLENHHANHIDTLNAQLRATKVDLAREVTEKASYRSEAEHKEFLITMLEEDLDELRQLTNEERLALEDKQKRKDLPPAYGCLDDDDRLPPYATCITDSGVLEVATFKRTIRDKYMRDMVTALKKFDLARARDGDSRGGSATNAFFLDLSSALADAARNIEDVLQRSSDVVTMHNTTTLGLFSPTIQDDVPDECESLMRRRIGRRGYIAGRIAKLALDLSLRLVAALEMRPLTFQLTPQEKTKAALEWTQLDTSLVEALRVAFAAQTAPSFATSTRLIDLQTYLTQIQMLQHRLERLFPNNRGPGRPGEGRAALQFFDLSWTWLSEQLERLRQAIANDDEQSVIVVDAIRTESEVSSEPGADTTGEED